jgi:hypothetical protein
VRGRKNSRIGYGKARNMGDIPGHEVLRPGENKETAVETAVGSKYLHVGISCKGANIRPRVQLINICAKKNGYQHPVDNKKAQDKNPEP